MDGWLRWWWYASGSGVDGCSDDDTRALMKQRIVTAASFPKRNKAQRRETNN